MSILGKPDKGSWGLNSDVFGANNTPAPDTLYMMEEGSGTDLANDGKDSGSYDGDITGADWSGTQSSGDGYLAFVEGNSDYVEVASALGITDYPFTFAAVVRSTTAPSGVTGLVCLGDASAGDVAYNLQINDQEEVGMRARNTTTYQENISTADLTDNAWHLAVVVFRSATDREIYQDDGDSADDTTSVTFNSGCDQFRIGAFADSSISNYLNADVAAVMVWKDTALTDAQVQTDLWNSGEVFPFLVAADITSVSSDDVVLPAEDPWNIAGSGFGDD